VPHLSIGLGGPPASSFRPISFVRIPFCARRKTPFHEFTPVSIIDRPGRKDPPNSMFFWWGRRGYLKGADLLIEAFLRLGAGISGRQIKIMGTIRIVPD